jgi:hypothetical protein
MNLAAQFTNNHCVIPKNTENRFENFTVANTGFNTPFRCDTPIFSIEITPKWCVKSVYENWSLKISVIHLYILV